MHLMAASFSFPPNISYDAKYIIALGLDTPGGPRSFMWSGATITRLGALLQDQEPLNLITAPRECKIKKEDDYYNCNNVLFGKNKQINYKTHL